MSFFPAKYPQGYTPNLLPREERVCSNCVYFAESKKGGLCGYYGRVTNPTGICPRFLVFIAKLTNKLA